MRKPSYRTWLAVAGGVLVLLAYAVAAVTVLPEWVVSRSHSTADAAAKLNAITTTRVALLGVLTPVVVIIGGVVAGLSYGETVRPLVAAWGAVSGILLLAQGLGLRRLARTWRHASGTPPQDPSRPLAHPGPSITRSYRLVPNGRRTAYPAPRSVASNIPSALEPTSFGVMDSTYPRPVTSWRVVSGRAVLAKGSQGRRRLSKAGPTSDTRRALPWSPPAASNRRPPRYERDALPTELEG